MVNQLAQTPNYNNIIQNKIPCLSRKNPVCQKCSVAENNSSHNKSSPSVFTTECAYQRSKCRWSVTNARYIMWLARLLLSSVDNKTANPRAMRN